MGIVHIIKSWQTIRLICFIFIIIYGRLAVVGKNLLSESVAYYEFLNYPRLGYPHSRERRSTNHGAELHIEFTAHGRTFNLGLKRDNSLFSNNLLIADNIDKFQTSNIYEGKLVDEPTSYVHGFVHDNIFEGRIRRHDGNEYQVESTEQYDAFDKNKAHSVIYNIKDVMNYEPYYCGGIVNMDPRHKKAVGFKSSAKKSNSFSIERTKLDLRPRHNRKVEINDKHNVKRVKRDVSSILPPPKLECQLHIRADPTYVINYANGDKNRAMYMMTQHVKFVKNMFESTDFDGDGINEGYTLVIKKLGVIDTSGCTANNASEICKFTNNNVGVAKFLDMVSTDDHSPFCLSYVFTHRNFDNGILGLAFTGSASGSYPGGICEKYQSFDGTMKTLNTGVVSSSVYGRAVSKKVTDITFAHEVAHNFGSGHDDKTNHTCVPNGRNGNYLMYSQAQYGRGKNNFVLSPCSRSAIWRNLQTKKEKCFKETGKPICGNRVVETGEDCDCGYATDDSCDKDQCCYGASDDIHSSCKFSYKAKRVPARLRCSPSQGECCNPRTCQRFENNTKDCSVDECEKVTKCISTSAQCPKPKHVPDRTYCNNKSKVCINGKCSGSICLLENKVDCECSAEGTQCTVCCMYENAPSSCAVLKYNGLVKRPLGSPCNRGNGRCNILSECQSINENGVLLRLKQWLFRKPSFVNIYEWAKVNWWACILMGLGLVLFTIGFVWCCKQFVPSDGKGKRESVRPFLCVNFIPESTEGSRSPSAPSNTSSRNYIRTPTSDPPLYDEPPPGYNTAVRENIRYPPSYELEIMR